MFGLFRNRKKYNGMVDKTLNVSFGIATRDNQNFPGMLAYLELIDTGWNASMSEDDCAFYIATLYYCGLLKNGENEEANALLLRINQIIEFGLSKNILSKSQCDKVLTAIKIAQNAYVKSSKLKVAGTIASLIDSVIDGEGIGYLLEGFIFIDNNFQVGFSGVNPPNKIASVKIKSLKNSEILNNLQFTEINDSSLLSPFIDQLVYEVINKFDVQSLEFRGLPEQ